MGNKKLQNGKNKLRYATLVSFWYFYQISTKLDAWLYIVYTGDSRWLELRSLEVKLWSRFFTQYNKANLLRSLEVLNLSN